MHTAIAQTEQTFINEVKTIIQNGQSQAYRAINSAMVETYWNLGKRIVEQEQQGEERAEYGAGLLKRLSAALTKEFGQGFSERSIRQYRQFYQMFSDSSIRRTPFAELQNTDNQPNTIVRTLFAQSWQPHFQHLTWSHIQRIMRVSNPEARAYYMKESAENTWSVRTLDRNISTLYYQRLLSSQVKEPVIAEMQEKTKELQNDPLEFIKNPTVMEFLRLPANTGYTESELEHAIIDQMQRFLLELGKGFAFVDRQKLIRTETSDFYIDLVFYNYILKCFVIIELKTNKITHQDIGQLDMYVRMYDDLERREGDNSTIGILLCTETDQVIAKYSVLNENKQVFATKYMDYLPTEEELQREIERQKEIYLQQKITNKIK
ncbi:MAG: PDDEXK nuclease domain-containing protein [Candidatus Symbiothrix sp.]|jgi:predicted nuclease of restriction endonuclease-like (RecB) superfamily|nr:PDDEXK nuclease domain-containing protein [Candidatus Symbiothrix sp.]